MPFEKALEIAKKLSGKVWGFKLNSLLHGGGWLGLLNEHGRLMFDPKLYDTPSTIANTLKEFIPYHPEYITIHASAGKRALKMALDTVKETVEKFDRCKIVAVTALTSFTEQETFHAHGCDRGAAVLRLGHIAEEAGVHGIVCSTKDFPWVQHLKVLKFCPGIRLEPIDDDDQAVTSDGAGADFVIVGRPITRAEDPVAALNKLNM
jgi:orotidine-5'-phosphate decarboxylase